MTSRLFAVVLLVLACFGIAAAQTPPTPDQAIELGDASQTDQAIVDRLTDIYAEIETLSGVTVEVNEGVVRLGGTVANESAALEAIELASRVQGIVAVDDQIVRTLEIGDNIRPVVDRVTDFNTTVSRAWPLYLLALLSFILIAGAGFFLAGFEPVWRAITPNPFIAHIVAQFVRIVFVVLGLLVMLTLLDAMALFGAVAGGAGLFGLAIGFAVRDTIENYLASVMLSLRQPFRASDFVKINEYEGIVIRLTSRATILMTLDGNHLRIPNATVFKGIILNYSRNPERRFDFTLGIGASDDSIEAIARGVETLRAQSFVLSEPAPSGYIKEVGDSNIVLRFFGWIDQRVSDFLKSRSAAIAQVKAALEDGGFTFPEPTYRLRIDPLKGAEEEEAAAAKSAGKRKTAPEPQIEDIDTSADDAIERHVEEEREAADDKEDLLSEKSRLE
ncbi:MAG: mechanosensitive ion channel domain-containing protein [Pseudomonadota bacterium]